MAAVDGILSYFKNPPDASTRRKIAFWLLAFSAGGVAVAAYLSYKNILHLEFGGCPVTGDGCDIVNKSKYSRFLGVPLGIYGIVYYSAIAFVSFAFLKNLFKKLFCLLPYLTMVGFILSVSFIYIQSQLIGAFCFYCETSAAIATILFAVSIPLFNIKRETKKTSPNELPSI